jgi:hypothetical protein
LLASGRVQEGFGGASREAPVPSLEQRCSTEGFALDRGTMCGYAQHTGATFGRIVSSDSGEAASCEEQPSAEDAAAVTRPNSCAPEAIPLRARKGGKSALALDPPLRIGAASEVSYGSVCGCARVGEQASSAHLARAAEPGRRRPGRERRARVSPARVSLSLLGRPDAADVRRRCSVLPAMLKPASTRCAHDRAEGDTPILARPR